ncbi:tRNA (guanosine(18)-2'-O)-methyltransferase TrmH [Marinibactrum halimedae]|uniref:tRNA (guanosine(18)-2'-O)-methyltransferase n=1 Tax=Marinibactrum halimedae TaxID=1444977 RepID=A0AA37T9E9_9GAMM|nr:tRNA (guanosine(18)-2'-O)-methyltransferase TrmH [Marinibactrum halimedae]MCD9459472.1 tRNA (guanosine(18)-2'-O)-methyltransferase TrmH [Marinibactrum halimedae]GLS28126.1 tRNA (guanosine(18)-2'-O)-methyltransferase [Marinibactrum halimedae]
MTPERYQRLREVLNTRQPDLTVIADEVHKGRNLSAIVRTCDAVGIDTIHSVVPDKGFRGYRGTASGSHKWVHVESHEDVMTPLNNLKSQGFQIVTTSVDADARSYVDVDYTKPTALLLGSEKGGVSHCAEQQADVKVTIPMFGMVESFNVSVAAAIILLEAQRQRVTAGLYESRRLDQGLYEKRLFQWSHPVIAQYCHDNHLDYPETREHDGEIKHPSVWYQTIRQQKISDT